MFSVSDVHFAIEVLICSMKRITKWGERLLFSGEHNISYKI